MGQERTIPERLAAIEVKLDIVCKRTAALDKLIPQIVENSWWIGKIKWGCATLVIVGVVGGIVKYACS